MKRWMTLVPAALLLLAMASPGLAANGKASSAVPAPVLLYDADGDRITENLTEILNGARGGEKIDVIIQLNEVPSDAVMSGLINHAGSFDVKAKWDRALNGFAASMTAAQIRALAKNPMVKQIEADVEVKALMSTATTWTGVTQARTDYGVDGDRDGSPTTYSTTDIVVAVIDTGIDKNHIDLDGGKVLAFRDEVNGQTTAYDDHGHGSHVAGIIAGTGEGNSAYKGVAPGAALVGIKVLNSAGSGTTTQIVNGINWMISNRTTYNIKVGNMSLGAAGCSNGTDSISAAVNNAVNNGIVMLVAAGNEGPAKCTIGAPAAAANAITVGAGIDPGEKGWGLAYFSSRGLTADGRLKPDIVTPGYNITSVARGTTNGYTTMSGTSMATPFAAGVVALMLDANPSMSVATVKSNLYNNVEDWGPAGHDLDYGRGLLKAYDAIKVSAGGSGTYSHGLSHSYVSGSLSTSGSYLDYTFTVTDATKPIGITLIMTNWSSSTNPDFDLYLYNPSGTQVAASEGTTRQETILYQPTVTGTYTVRVKSYTGTGAFFFDRSWK
jgi:serine protease AprX